MEARFRGRGARQHDGGTPHDRAPIPHGLFPTGRIVIRQVSRVVRSSQCVRPLTIPNIAGRTPRLRRSARAFAVNPSRLKARPLRASGG
jgi:hypothetical protein